MNSDALKTFNSKFNHIKDLEESLIKLQNLRALKAARHDSKRRKTIKAYDDRKAVALKKLEAERLADLLSKDEEIRKMIQDIELQKRGLLEVAKETLLPPTIEIGITPSVVKT